MKNATARSRIFSNVFKEVELRTKSLIAGVVAVPVHVIIYIYKRFIIQVDNRNHLQKYRLQMQYNYILNAISA